MIRMRVVTDPLFFLRSAPQLHVQPNGCKESMCPNAPHIIQALDLCGKALVLIKKSLFYRYDMLAI
jgi:hypothetical protein